MGEEGGDLSCVLCGEEFAIPHCAPLLLPCTHMACSKCLRKAQIQRDSQIVCPIDLEANPIGAVRNDPATRQLILRVVQQQQRYNQNNQLLRIQALSRHFEGIFQQKSQARIHFQNLIETIIMAEVERLQSLRKRIMGELTWPLTEVRQWKNMVREYLTSLKQGRELEAGAIASELGHYISEGRRIKRDLNRFQEYNFQEMGSVVAANPQICLASSFSLDSLVQPALRKEGTQDIWNEKVNHVEESSFQSQHSVSHQSRKNACKNLSFSSKRAESVKPSKELLLSVERENHNPTSRFIPLSEKSPSNILPSLSSKSPSSVNQLLAYSPSPAGSIIPHPAITEQLLLKEETSHLLPRTNFLREWGLEVTDGRKATEVQQKLPFDWKKENNNYIRKLERMQTCQAQLATNRHGSCLQLINHSIQGVDLQLYLEGLELENIQVIKLVRTGLTDCQLNDLFNAILPHRINTLVLSGNCLTEMALDGLLHFSQVNSHLRNVYLSKNGISCLKSHSRQKISLLRENGMTLYI